jgi:hypothetical protein
MSSIFWWEYQPIRINFNVQNVEAGILKGYFPLLVYQRGNPAVQGVPPSPDPHLKNKD